SLGISFVFAGYRLGGNDEGALLTAAGKILRGGVFYRDINAYPFPGAHYLLAGTMALFGEHLGVARGLAACSFAALVGCLYALALRLLGRPRAALYGVSLLGFKLLAWPAFTAFFYWDLALLAACTAIWLFLAGHDAPSPRRLGLVGVCVGLALITKQNVGIYLASALFGILLFAAREGAPAGGREGIASNRAGMLPVAAGIAVTVLPGVIYFAFHGLLPELLRSGLIRPFTDYATTSSISFFRPLQWWQLSELQGTAGFSYFPETVWTLLRRQLLPGGEAVYSSYWLAGELFVRGVYSAMALTFVGACLQWFRPAEGTLRERRRLQGRFALLCFAVTISAFPRADFAHMMGIYPLVLLLLFSVTGELAERLPGGTARTLRAVEVGLVAGILSVVSVLSVVLLGSMTERLELSRADLRVWPEDAFVASVVRYVEENVPEDRSIFVYGHEAYYYFLSGRYTPWPFSQLYPGQAGRDAGQTLAALLDEKRPPLIIQGFTNFPGVPSLKNQIPKLDAFIRAQYQATPMPFRRYPPPFQRIPPPHRLQVLAPRR
ncbi:MAG: glycosyltransferase family 39 protein, partial [Deltaproteobacteria bacterium]|nr:glycosyltransferase family 39 protein [Deltaproteobacteria bacterium]